jgi:putative membrane protein
VVRLGHTHVGRPLGENPLLQVLSVGYLAIWVWSAVAPLDRDTWWLENLLVFGWVGLLAATHRQFVFSNLSYALMLAFLALHAVGSHYTYSTVPLGAWLQEAFEQERNHYDRAVHFAFGALLAYPVRELVLRVLHVHRIWSYVLPTLVVLATSSVYEIIESWAARLVAPAVGVAFLGAQGDVWDGQKDMTLAWIGSILAMTAAAIRRRQTGREPYLG